MHARKSVVCALGLIVGSLSQAQAQSVSDVFKRVNRSVVVVYTSERTLASGAPGQFVDIGGLGSGVLVSNNGEVLTAAHVVQSAERVMVQFTTGERIAARVLGSVPSADLALLRLEHRPSGVVPATLGNSDSVEVGDQVLVIGSPLGVSHTLTVGHVSGRRQLNRTMGAVFQAELLQTDAAINQGNSGGPMFNMAGEVIGIVSHIISQSGGSEGLGFVVTSNMARDLLLEGTSLWSGIDGFQLSEGLALILNVPPPSTGLLVQRVARGSLGERLGLEGGTVSATISGEDLILGGDIVLTFQGIAIAAATSEEQLRAAVASLKPGDRIVVTVLRAGAVTTLTTTFVLR
ncbi:MAG: trypsin-like peptidase domain-containing protein [Gemmatimonadetes bacterium]|nr:trypsin-like peptidase domain-containing protein [Gemmatimonadota bacterium]